VGPLWEKRKDLLYDSENELTKAGRQWEILGWSCRAEGKRGSARHRRIKEKT